MSGQQPKEEATVSNPGLGPDAAAPGVVPGKWVCAQSSQSKSNNFNKHITDKLEVLAKAYTHQGDKWRALSYSKAVNALKSYHKPVTSYQVVSYSFNLHWEWNVLIHHIRSTRGASSIEVVYPISKPEPCLTVSGGVSDPRNRKAHG